MKLVHSPATLSQVHSNIWTMTVFSVDGARLVKDVLLLSLARKGRPWTATQSTPKERSVANWDQDLIGTSEENGRGKVRERRRVRYRFRVYRVVIFTVSSCNHITYMSNWNTSQLSYDVFETYNDVKVKQATILVTPTDNEIYSQALTWR